MRSTTVPGPGPGHPAATYAYSEDRKGEHPATHLKGFRRLLQIDGYAGFDGLETSCPSPDWIITAKEARPGHCPGPAKGTALGTSS